MLTISQNQKDNVVIFVIDGRVDSEGAMKMEETLYHVVKAGNFHLVLDLSQTNYMNSAGLRTLADVLTQCREQGGDLKLAAPNPKILRVLQIIGFDKFFNVYDNLDEAVQD